MTDRDGSDDMPPCTCGSLAVIDERRHAPDCKRRLWIEQHEADESDDGSRCTCDRDTILDGMATPGCPVHVPDRSDVVLVPACHRHEDEPTLCPWCEVERLREGYIDRLDGWPECRYCKAWAPEDEFEHKSDCILATDGRP
jgi:hypothetical protein